jgi:iron(III) transport system substrate-binding protein
MQRSTRRAFAALAVLAAVAVAAAATGARAQVPAGYPGGYQAIVDAAKKEGKVVVYTPTDAAAGRPLVREFEAMYPGVHVDYEDMNSTELFNRFISETAAGTSGADVVWNSAMDAAMKLVNDGYALAYDSPEAKHLPEWAVYQRLAWGTTFEPVGVVYNKRRLPAADVPRTHAEFLKLISDTARFHGKVTSFDVEKSGSGFLFLTNDARVNEAMTWDIVRALGRNNARLLSSTGAMMEGISSGEQLIGYNLFASYAHSRAKKDPNIGYALLKDYTLVLSRVAFISKAAKHPNAARLWLDYLLSKKGQTTLSTASELYSIRGDVDGETTAAGLAKELGATLKPIQIGPGLLTYLDRAKRLEFLKQWRTHIVGK